MRRAYLATERLMIIAHRLSTMRQADRLLDRSRIVKEGVSDVAFGAYRVAFRAL